MAETQLLRPAVDPVLKPFVPPVLSVAAFAKFPLIRVAVVAVGVVVFIAIASCIFAEPLLIFDSLPQTQTKVS